MYSLKCFLKLDNFILFYCSYFKMYFLGPRRMSERDLPSKVDSERTIPSSKSVPTLHHISPNSEQSRPIHDVFNPGYSRTSSNNSINTNSVAQITQNTTFNSSALRSRSTHNLLQQDNGFYQNLSIYRNKMPNQLGDRLVVIVKRSGMIKFFSTYSLSKNKWFEVQSDNKNYSWIRLMAEAFYFWVTKGHCVVLLIWIQIYWNAISFIELARWKSDELTYLLSNAIQFGRKRAYYTP